MTTRKPFIIAAALALAATPAFAHVGVGDTSHFHSGLFHPFHGLDHILAMVAVGLYASQIGGRSLILVPLAFVATMVAGGVLGKAGVWLPMVEQGIALSVVLMGLLIAAGVRLSTVIAMALVGVFALFHGHAHGGEGPEAASFLPYAAGFVLATTFLHIVGIALGLLLDRLGDARAHYLTRGAGAAGTLAGVAILLGAV
jgi:urease accessory protein